MGRVSLTAHHRMPCLDQLALERQHAIDGIEVEAGTGRLYDGLLFFYLMRLG